MGHCAVQFDETCQTCLGIITPWQIYAHNVLPQGMKIAVDFYQMEMVKLNSGLDHVKIFLEDTATLGRSALDEHAEEINEVLARLETAGSQVNMQKIKWAVIQEKCLGHVASTDGHNTAQAKIKGLVVMKEPKNKRQVRRFLGGMNFCRKMWRNRSHALAPLIALAGNASFMWNETHQKAFDGMKAIASKENMSCCPN